MEKKTKRQKKVVEEEPLLWLLNTVESIASDGKDLKKKTTKKQEGKKDKKKVVEEEPLLCFELTSCHYSKNAKWSQTSEPKPIAHFLLRGEHSFSMYNVRVSDSSLMQVSS